MSSVPTGLLPAITTWLRDEPAVQAAVLFGSGARTPEAPAAGGSRRDLDLHVVTSEPNRLEHVDWARVMPDHRVCFQAVRPATGGVRKVTVLFAAGEIDLIPVPAARFRLARLAMRCGLHHRWPALRVALNEMATCMQTGYRVLKGEKEWGPFYARVVAEMPGVRLADAELTVLADVFLCDLLWVFQKLERGELSAAQHVLHRTLAENNFRFLRELRLRRGEPLPSFGLGRRVETILAPEQLAWVKVDARLQRDELDRAAWGAFKGLKAMMGELIPAWREAPGMDELLAPYAKRPE